MYEKKDIYSMCSHLVLNVKYIHWKKPKPKPKPKTEPKPTKQKQQQTPLENNKNKGPFINKNDLQK